jgi:hypothetical protein
MSPLAFVSPLAFAGWKPVLLQLIFPIPHRADNQPGGAGVFAASGLGDFYHP